MKNLNENRKQILLRMVSKSHQLINDIARVSAQIDATNAAKYLNETHLFAPHDSISDKKDLEYLEIHNEGLLCTRT